MSAIIISYFFAEKFAREIIWIWLLNLGRIKVICIIFSVHCRQLLSHIQLLATPWATVHQVSLSCTISQTLLKFMCVELMVPSNHLILCHPLLLPSVFPSIRVFPSKSALWIRWSKYWSFSISPSNEYSGLISFGIDWFDLPCSPRYSQESSPAPQFKSIRSSALNLFYGPALTSVHDYWKNHIFDYTNFCQQRAVSAFQYAV